MSRAGAYSMSCVSRPRASEGAVAKKREPLKSATDALTRGARSAADALVGLVSSSDEKVRLAASRAVLEEAIRLRELAELEAMVKELQERLEEVQQGRKQQ